MIKHVITGIKGDDKGGKAMPDGNIQAYIGDPPEQFGHVDDVVEIKYFIKALETRLKYCPKQDVKIIISPETARQILRALKRGIKQ